jgi:Putative metallopeptidase
MLFQGENVMKAAVLALVITGAALLPQAATMAQTAPAQRSEVSVMYLPPKDPAHQPIYEQIKEIGFLEKVREFLSPIRLPRTLFVKLEGCDGDANASYENDTIVICYEYIDELWKNMPEETTEDGVIEVDALAGPLLDTILHEFAHAMFDMLRVPVLGREEEAADQVAAYIMLRLGKAEARRLIAGAAYAYKTEAEAAKTSTGIKQFAGVHGTPAQRFYNLLCLAYGADPQLFSDFVEKGHLPKERAEGCKEEYQQFAYAFQQLIEPHLDPVLAKEVTDKTWLPDAKWRVQRRRGSE